MIFMLAWEEIMSKCPTMKKIVEDKIAEEVTKKDEEIAELKAQVNELTIILGDLILGGM